MFNQFFEHNLLITSILCKPVTYKMEKLGLKIIVFLKKLKGIFLKREKYPFFVKTLWNYDETVLQTQFLKTTEKSAIDLILPV